MLKKNQLKRLPKLSKKKMFKLTIYIKNMRVKYNNIRKKFKTQR